MLTREVSQNYLNNVKRIAILCLLARIAEFF